MWSRIPPGFQHGELENLETTFSGTWVSSLGSNGHGWPCIMCVAVIKRNDDPAGQHGKDGLERGVIFLILAGREKCMYMSGNDDDQEIVEEQV
jgi:hypothetical protein